MSTTQALVEALAGRFEALRASLPARGPGFSALVLVHGQVRFELHHGLACLELEVPLSGRSAYYLGSESKPFTAACVMDLVRRGALALDDDVCLHLPEVRAFEARLPLRSLLNHSSGIPDYFAFLECQLERHEDDYFGNTMLLRLIARMDELRFVPGERHGYSNSNYILLAALVERLSGQSLGCYAREHLLAPLGMRASGYDEDRFSLLPNRVRSYSVDASRPGGWRQHLANANTVGDGGMVACSDDLVHWEADWHRQWADAGSLLHASLQPSALNDGSLPSYRFGLEWLQAHGHDVVFHGGHLWGFHSLILRLPAWGISVVQLGNHGALEADAAALLADLSPLLAELSPPLASA